MSRGRIAIMLTVRAMVAVTLAALGAGCGSESTEFDKATNYTPESLAQELIFRYRALRPEAQAVKPRSTKKKSGPPDSSGIKKSEFAPAKEKRAPATLDDVMEDIEHKVTLIKDTGRAETTKKMIETISSDPLLKDGDKKTLTELVGRLAD
jgi:hypothetical protein